MLSVFNVDHGKEILWKNDFIPSTFLREGFWIDTQATLKLEFADKKEEHM